MHYSQGRDRWFGRIQSAPTVNQDQTTAGGTHRAASLRPLVEERKEI
ncbi:hypothetical protein [Phocaeicola sp.]